MIIMESNLCFRTHAAILNRDRKLFDECINNDYFDINERFSTSEREDENYLMYSLKLGNLYATNKLLNLGGLRLSIDDKQRMLEYLSLNKKYLLLIKSIKKIEGRKISINKYINTIKKQDYNELYKKVR